MADAKARRNKIVCFVEICNHKLLHMVTNSVIETENNESDDDNFEEILLIRNILRIRGKQYKPVRITGYIQNVIPRYNTRQFRNHFRMKPEVFENLENRLGQLLYEPEKLGRPMIPVRTQLLATIWLLSTPDSFRYIIILKF